MGEGIRANDTNELKNALKKQIEALFDTIQVTQFKNVVLAYEPEWAIGKANSADTDYIESAHQALREIIRELGGDETLVRIIYGGSVSKENAAEIVRQKMSMVYSSEDLAINRKILPTLFLLLAKRKDEIV